jgi:hypothetical protein
LWLTTVIIGMMTGRTRYGDDFGVMLTTDLR